jgi:hypothetical protein
MGLQLKNKKNAGSLLLLLFCVNHTHTYTNSWQIDENLDLHDGFEDGIGIIFKDFT